jgi:hypothetical protein
VKEVILGVLAVLSIIAVVKLKRAATKENINGLCNVECKDCTEKDWCIFRYKGQGDKHDK